MRKPVLCYSQTANIQTSLFINADWSQPLLPGNIIPRLLRILTVSTVWTNAAYDKLIFSSFPLKKGFDIHVNLHEMSNSIFWKNKTKIFPMLTAKMFAQCYCINPKYWNR